MADTLAQLGMFLPAQATPDRYAGAEPYNEFVPMSLAQQAALMHAFATSPSVQAAKSAATLPADVYAGRQPMGLPSETEDLSRVADLAGLAMTGGIGGAPKGAVGSGPIRAYHASPYDFDRFDFSKIGTGEGAQAYGHGGYFAGSEAVAKEGYLPQFHGGQRLDHGPISEVVADALRKEVPDFGQPGSIAEWVVAQRAKAPADAVRSRIEGSGWSPEQKAAGTRALDILEATAAPAKARMYEVAIHADPERFLDWDKPLSAQGAPAMKALKAVAQSDRGSDTWLPRFMQHTPDIPGQGVYNSLEQQLGYKGAPRVLNEAGIPGIKYLDAGSRAAGDGSRNYVVFKPEIIEILRKYGLAGMAALPPALLGAMNVQDNH